MDRTVSFTIKYIKSFNSSLEMKESKVENIENENFLTWGGTSIQATRIIDEISTHFNLSSLGDVQSKQTV